jgi:hypothetical protein
MLMEIEPASEVTGGLVNHEAFNLDIIEVVHDRILDYLKSHGNTSYKEIALYVKQMGVLSSGQEYKDEHIRQIVQVLVFDQKVEPVHGQVDVFKLCGITNYISGNAYPYKLTYSEIPCAHCPVRSQCAPGNLINPKACEYMQ